MAPIQGALRLQRLFPYTRPAIGFDPSNYRPISVLNSLNLVAENVIKLWFSNLLEDNQLIDVNQFGFSRNSNIAAAALQMTQLLATSLDVGNYTAAIFLDISKAFDCVPHDLLLAKIGKMNLRPNERNEHSLLSSYLRERTQFRCSARIRFQAVNTYFDLAPAFCFLSFDFFVIRLQIFAILCHGSII